MRKLAAFLLLVGCVEVTAPDDATPIVPIPAEYRVWWAEMESCSGFDRDIDDVRFYSVAVIGGDPWRSGRAEWESGAASVILLRADLVADERLVKHEMMHVLGRFTTHPPRYFSGVCGPLMGEH